MAEGTNQESPVGGRPAPGRRRTTRRIPWLVPVVAVIVIVASFGTYYYIEATASSCVGGPHSLVVETYDTFFDSGPAPLSARAEVFGGFENATHSRVCVEYVTGDLATTLLTSGAPRPDVVVGLDELTAPRLDAAGLLIPYAPPQLANVPPGLVANLAPDHSAVPYEYGFIGLDYNVSYDDAHGSPFSTGNYLDTVENNRSLASQFLYEVPPDITGEEFLVMQIAFSTEILHENWTDFWHAIGPVAPSTTDWGTGFSEFSVGSYASFVSYTTDPAYDAYFGPVGAINTSVVRYGGQNYSWESIYGVGIVRGGVHNLTLAEKFENWLLSGPIQDAIPLNEWEYPANDTTALPGVFSCSVPPTSITPLNSFEPANVTAANLPGWILEWQSAVSG
jgi:thiamine transport system substrate-binding protein